MQTSSSESAKGPFKGPERRACDRLPVRGLSPVTLIDGDLCRTCRIGDVSLAGLRLEFDGEPPAPGPIVLEHKVAGRIEGIAVWRQGSRLGVRLAEAESDLRRALLCLNMMKSHG